MRYIAKYIFITWLLCHNLAYAAEDTTITPLSTEETFAILDENQDGFITLEEAKKLKGLPEKFDVADINHDGQLILTEFADTEAME